LCIVITTGIPERRHSPNTEGDIRGYTLCICTTSGLNSLIYLRTAYLDFQL
jgi:hypothetical protein